MDPDRRITLSNSTIILTVGLGLLLVVLWQLKGLLVILMISVVLAATLAPLVERAETAKVPRFLAVAGVYLGLLALISLFFLILGPTIAEQIQKLLQKLPSYLDALASLLQQSALHLGVNEPDSLDWIDPFFNLQALTGWAIQSGQQLVLKSIGFTKGLVGFALNLILAVLISAYMLADSYRLIQGIVNLFPMPWNDRLAALVTPMSQRMGGYLQGRLVVSLILGIAISIGLRFIGLSEFALGLGAIAGVTNLIPFFGPVLGAIPALIVAVPQEGLTFWWVLLLYVVIQNLETYFLDPLLVGPTVKIVPLYQLLAVLGGAQVLGILGALIAPPWVAGAAVLLENLYLQPKLLAEQQIRSNQ